MSGATGTCALPLPATRCYSPLLLPAAAARCSAASGPDDTCSNTSSKSGGVLAHCLHAFMPACCLEAHPDPTSIARPPRGLCYHDV